MSPSPKNTQSLSSMDHAAISVLVFGVYMIIEGLVLLFFPNTLFSIAGIPETTEVWAHVVGWAMFVLGYYYIHAARYNVRPFFWWTVHIRLAQFVVFAVFAWVFALPTLLLFSGIELGAGVWTLIALLREKRLSHNALQ